MVVRPARAITVLKPTEYQTDTSAIVTSARLGPAAQPSSGTPISWPNSWTTPRGSSAHCCAGRPSHCRTELATPTRGWKIQRHTTAAATVEVMYGRK